MLKLNNRKNFESAFTLVELLVVIVILGVLATIGLEAFVSAQARGRDAERKSDLKQISSSLELYYSDYGKYPDSSSGKIIGCPTTTSTPCVWAAIGNTSTFTDGKTVYFETLPGDPSQGSNFYYKAVPINSVPNQGFQLFAHLENSQDMACLSGVSGKSDCTNPTNVPSGVTCGAGNCNFAVTSPNTTPTQ